MYILFCIQTEKAIDVIFCKICSSWIAPISGGSKGGRAARVYDKMPGDKMPVDKMPGDNMPGFLSKRVKVVP